MGQGSAMEGFYAVDDLLDDRLILDMIEGDRRDFCEQTYDEIFEEEDFTIIVRVKGYPFFVFLEKRVLREC